jgi:hypothetical protein
MCALAALRREVAPRGRILASMLITDRVLGGAYLRALQRAGEVGPPNESRRAHGRRTPSGRGLGREEAVAVGLTDRVAMGPVGPGALVRHGPGNRAEIRAARRLTRLEDLTGRR